MDVKLYYVPPSFFSQKALLCLEEKRVKFEPLWVHLHEGETYQPWFMKINPLGQVPVLVHGDNNVSDTPSIVKYLDEKFDGPILSPDVSTTIGAKVKEIDDLFISVEIDLITFGYMKHGDIREDSQIPEMILQRVNNEKSQQGFTEGTANETFEKFTRLAEENPDLKEAYLFKREQLMKRSTSLTKEAIFAALEDPIKTFDAAEKMLRQNEEEGNADHWLCGPDFTVADIDMAVLLKRFAWLGAAKRTFRNGNYTYVDKYYKRLLQRPSVVKILVDPNSKLGLIKYMIWAKLTKPIKLAITGIALVGITLVGIGIWASHK